MFEQLLALFTRGVTALESIAESKKVIADLMIASAGNPQELNEEGRTGEKAAPKTTGKKASAKTGAKQEAQAETKVETKVETKEETKVETKVETKPDGAMSEEELEAKRVTMAEATKAELAPKLTNPLFKAKLFEFLGKCKVKRVSDCTIEQLNNLNIAQTLWTKELDEEAEAEDAGIL